MVQAMRKLPAAAYVKPTHKRLKAFRNPFEPFPSLAGPVTHWFIIGFLLSVYFTTLIFCGFLLAENNLALLKIWHEFFNSTLF